MLRKISASVGVAMILAVGAILCSMIWTRALIRARSRDETIRVIGSARKPIHSDLIIWNGSLSESAPTVAQGYGNLQAKTTVVQEFLSSRGVPKTDVSLQGIAVETLYAQPKTVTGPNGVVTTEAQSAIRPINGYRMTQSIQIRSSKVDLVESVSRQSSELLSKNVVLQSTPPLYLYTKMSEIKITMQAEAARDAFNRASQIATNAGCRLGDVRYARMNAPSITPYFNKSEDDGGIDDTSSLDKKITAVVTVGYGIR